MAGAGQVDTQEPQNRQILERTALRLPIQIFRVGNRHICGLLRLHHDQDQAVRVGNRPGANQDGIDDGKNGAVDPDTHDKSCDDQQSHAGPLAHEP